MQGRPDGTVCLCWRATGDESGDPTALELVSLDDDMRVRSRTTVTYVDGIDAPGRPNGPTQVALEPSPDGEYAYLARAVRSATTWQVSLDVIDLGDARVVATVDLLRVADPRSLGGPGRRPADACASPPTAGTP